MCAAHRRSKHKEAILRVVKGTDSHPTAGWIYQQTKRAIPNISLGTVYRNLKLLKEGGEISELSLADTQSRFDGVVENHYHFRCEQCGRVFDVDEPVDKEIDNWVSHNTGLKISHHVLEFRGRCADCDSRQAKSLL